MISRDYKETNNPAPRFKLDICSKPLIYQSFGGMRQL